ncbi:MAG: single-stranded DNA-binding protein [Candidatus Moranbacteria bacterium CG_4_9_14_3_um_filter_40_7]|nr:MAG: single-stranded DNA-binding protein [Candidatus Moranbacteria bacterium CG23_combo_of_CG06-09_8_20_14_all_40_16]PIU80646.1 MAG: single-stranded DNA-binding protein [Candidatus Moranbacteria bacterium CG06_land_8_20_14_3_00_40_12]PJA88193.1 MAG: single-stranded DNA-binding protein [Candidatus Moranbacteria bacterium CG_4_9_14_3_um_filter_40_7]
MNVNKVLLVGRLTREPEIRTTSSGQSVASLSIATNSFWKDKSGQKQERTEFHNIVLWGRLAEIAGQYLVKGAEVFIEGRLQTRKYTAKDGTEKRTTEIVGENMQLGAKPQNRPYTPNVPANNSASAQGEKPQEEAIPTINLDEEQDEVKIADVPF